MKDLITVTKFSFLESVKRKSYIISIIIFMVLIIVGFNVPNIIKSLDKSGTDNEKVLVLDKDKVYDDLESFKKVLEDNKLDYELSFDVKDNNDMKKKIKNDDYDLGLVIENKDGVITYTYIIDNVYTISEPTDLTATLENYYIQNQYAKVGLTEEQLSAINTPFTVEHESIEEEATSNNFVMMLISILLFFAIFYCAVAVSSSITTEKTSKIIETLVTSTSPTNIVLGKTIGIGLSGLLEFVIILCTALISGYLFLDKDLLTGLIDISTITPSLIIITIIYFILGYLLYAIMFALTGSTVEKPEDIQNANGPVSIIAVVAFYLSYFSMIDPTSTLSVVSGYIPFSSAFSIPLRIMMGLSSGFEVFASIAILVLTIMLIAYISIKIYSNAILNTGNKLSIKYLIKMFKQR